MRLKVMVLVIIGLLSCSCGYGIENGKDHLNLGSVVFPVNNKFQSLKDWLQGAELMKTLKLDYRQIYYQWSSTD